MKVNNVVVGSAVVVAAFALSACGSQEQAGPTTVTAPQTVTVPASAPQSSGGDSAESAHGGAGTTRTVSADSTESGGSAAPVSDSSALFTHDGQVHFFTPSRNIACGMNTDLAGCQVFRTSVLPPNADCAHGTPPIDQMAKGYYSEKGGPFVPSCFNQGVFFGQENQKTLQYGHSITANGMTCLSETAGVTCRRGDHGFFVSVQRFSSW